MTNLFETVFSEFIDGQEYDAAANALFTIVRASFKAGWEAAGGDPPSEQPIIQLLPKKPNE